MSGFCMYREGYQWCGYIFLTCPCLNIPSIPYFFHPTKAYSMALEMGGKWYYGFCILISVENLLMTLIPAFLIQPTGLAHFNYLKPIVLSAVITGEVLGGFFLVIYYCCCRQEDDEEDSEQFIV
jgi:hypothetical protein